MPRLVLEQAATTYALRRNRAFGTTARQNARVNYRAKIVTHIDL
jgi:hypothetical protein